MMLKVYLVNKTINSDITIGEIYTL